MRTVYTSLQLLWVGCAVSMLGIVPFMFAEARKSGESWFLVADAVVFASYLVSFFLGNLGYLRGTYSEIVLAGTPRPGRVMCDLVLLTMHTCAFGGLALTLADCRAFTHWLVFLLLSDVWWWFYEPRTRPTRLRRIWHVWKVSLAVADVFDLPVQTQYHPRTWLLNNLMTAIIICACLRLASPESCVILNVAAVLVGVLSRTIDFKKTGFWMV